MVRAIQSGIVRIIHAIFNPPADSIEILYRKRLFTIYMLLFITPLCILGIVHFSSGFVAQGVINIILTLVFICLIAVLQRLKSGKWVFRIALVIIQSLMANWLVSAPPISYFPSIFVLTLPPFIFYLMGRYEGLFWTAVLSLMTIIVFMNPGSMLLSHPYPQDYIIRHLIALFLIVLFTYNYETVRVRFRNAMLSEQAKLVREKELLAHAKDEVDTINAMLEEEVVIRREAEEKLLKHQDHLEDLVAERTREIRDNALRLEASEKRFRLLADNLNDIIWSMDLDMRFSFISPSVTAMYGYTVGEAMALPLDRYNTPASLATIAAEFVKQMELERSGTADPNRYSVMQLTQIKKDGALLDVELKVSFMRDADGAAIGLVGITRDITERVQHQREKEIISEQLAQAQKLDALGTLVGGLAHDFNNILTGIMGSFELLKLSHEGPGPEDREKTREYLDNGLDSSRRSAELISQLLALSKKHTITLSPVDVNEALRYILKLCRNSLPKSVELDFRFSERPLVVMGDMVQIEQVLLNLCINASHAMTIMRPPGSRQGGVLAVEACEMERDPGMNMKALHPEGNDDVKTWVRIQVSDTGVGMDQETRRRIFEPFFSLKQKHAGTGLGLSISYNIIRKHGGFITVYSDPGAGSRFSIYIPFHVNGGGNIRNREREEAVVRGTGTILVIDDEALVLNTAEGLLKEFGYTVLTADSADRGIALYRENHDAVSAVLIDLSMPLKSGLDVFRELKRIDSGVRAMLTSGMMDDESRESARDLGILDFINKPYRTRELSEKIKALAG